MFVYSVLAIRDGCVFHCPCVSVGGDIQGAESIGWHLCYQQYPLSRGYTGHQVQIYEVEKYLVAQACNGLQVHL